MTNRIGPVDPNSIGKLGNKLDETGGSRKVSGDQAASQNSGGPAPAGRDTVELTSSAKLLEKLEKSLSSSPDIDVSRVREVKTAIESGDYEINADAIADAMIRFERATSE